MPSLIDDINPARVPAHADRPMPQNIEAEQALLSAMIWSQDALQECLIELVPDDFYSPANRVIFNAVKRMFDEGRPIDVITLADVLKSEGNLEKAGGPEHLVGLGENYVADVWPNHIEMLRRDAILRSMIKASASISALAYNAPEDTKEVIDRAEQMLFEVTGRSVRSTYEPLSNVMSDYFVSLEEMSKNKGMRQGIYTGYPDIDRNLLGMRPGQMVVIGARPGVGKTSFALNIAVNAARAGASIAFFSMEMSKVEIAQRLLACETTGVHMREIRAGLIRDANWINIIEATDKLSQLDITIDDTAGTTVTEIRAKARRILNGKKEGLVIIDYMQLLSPSAGRRSDSRATEVSEMSRSIKILAKDLGVPVIALSQLNRQVESRGGGRGEDARAKRPQLADLRESGSIEQDADIVLLLDRSLTKEEAERSNRPDWGVAECIIAKNRSGETGTVQLAFIAEDTKFISLDIRHEA
ncbi:replicative DNA helicase [Coriobacteriales bacterium OH1046]|nr:replicative DNA helicase [Coriobacteriales bacterium OH1046]